MSHCNHLLLTRLPEAGRTYLSTDSVEEAHNADLLTPVSVLDWVTRNRIDGIPTHTLHVKVGAVFCLLHNLSLDRGLVKNTQVIIVGLGNKLITVRPIEMIGGASMLARDDVLLPHIKFKAVLPSKHTLCRVQFPIAPAYATTFNSCQGLTLDVVGIDLLLAIH